MGLFKSKQEKEFERRRLVKKTLNDMNKHVNELGKAKKLYIEKAKMAKQKGLGSSYSLAISGLKMTLAQEKRAHEMLLNFEITSQMKDMSQMTSEFLRGLGTLSKEMVQLTRIKEFEKVQQQFEMAMQGVEMQTERLDAFMEINQDTFANQSVDIESVSDDEIDKLINDQMVDDDIDSDKLDLELEALQKRLGQSQKE